MQIVIDIPEDHKRVIDNLVCDGKEYLLPHEVEVRLARAVKIGTVIHNNATNGDVIKAMFPNCEQKEHINNGYFEMYFNNDLEDASYMMVSKDFWYTPYKTEKWVNFEEELKDVFEEELKDVFEGEVEE